MMVIDVANGHHPWRSYFHVLDKTGTIAENNNAGLVLLDQNPLKIIYALRSVNIVIVKGRYLNRESLNRMLEVPAIRKSS